MKKINFPTAYTVLLIIAALVAGLTYLVPAGKYELLQYISNDAEVEQLAQKVGDNTFYYAPTQSTLDSLGITIDLAAIRAGKDTNFSIEKSMVKKGTFLHIGKDTTIEYAATQAVLDKFKIKADIEKFLNNKIKKPVAVPNSYYEVEANPQGLTAFVQSPLRGVQEGIDIILFVLIIGGFIGLINYSGAFDAGVSALATSMQGRETLLIVLVTFLIALGGTTFGLAEETIAFYPILVPIFIAARYDAIVALGAIYIGSSVGTMVSTVNPFSAIIASDAAGINWADGLLSRGIMLVLCLGVCLWYIIRYAERIRKDPTQSIIYDQKQEIEAMFAIDKDAASIAFTTRIKLTLIIFALSFGVMIYGVYSLDWWFLEMTTVFFVASVIVGFVAAIPEKTFVREFVKGANDLLGVALIIGIARGITILMDEGNISASLLYYASGSVEGMSKGIFANAMLFIYGGLSFFIPSSSGMAVLSMPVMAPLADVVDAPREVVVDAYQMGMGLMAFITPTGLILASLAMVNVTYDKWLKFVLPLLGILTVMSMIYLTIKVYL